MKPTDVIDADALVKPKRKIKTRFKAYRAGEWMTNHRIDNVLLALTGMEMTYPTAYDIVIGGIKRLVDSDTRNKWTCVTVNTDHSSGRGYHYNHVVFGISQSGVPLATFLEPLPESGIS